MSKKSQVWVETVIYTLIGLAIIGLVLSLAKPKIDEIRDEIVVEQTITALNDLDATVNEVSVKGVDNRRRVDFVIRKGKLVIDSQQDKIFFEIEDASVLYSELGEVTHVGGIDVLTTEQGRKYKIVLTLDYSQSLNITYDSQDSLKSFQKASTPYLFSIENRAVPLSQKVNVDFREVS